MPKIIFVTGASGLLGSRIVLQLLERGYHVRATARGSKADLLREGFFYHRHALQVIPMMDVCTDDLGESLSGVYGVIHTASPPPGRYAPDEMFQIAEEGTLNVLRQAERAGVTRIVVTSSFAAVRNPNGTWKHDDWNSTTQAEAIQTGNPTLIYAVAKTCAEKAVWEWAAEHPHVEVTSRKILGPLTPNFFLIPSPDFNAIVTNIALLNLISPHGVFHWNNFQVDIRDIARAHILALDSPPTSLVGRKRLVFASPHSVSWSQAVDYIAENRPMLRSRLITATPSKFSDRLDFDFSRIVQVLGVKETDCHSWEQTVLDGIDSLVQLEDIWKTSGHSVEIPGFSWNAGNVQ